MATTGATMMTINADVYRHCGQTDASPSRRRATGRLQGNGFSRI